VVIVVNSSYEAVPFADFLFFGDASWWETHCRREAIVAFSVAVSVRAAGKRLLRRLVPPPGLRLDPTGLVSERTSLRTSVDSFAG
jgi:hypothetical protein